MRDLLGLGEDSVASVARLRILLASEPSIHLAWDTRSVGSLILG